MNGRWNTDAVTKAGRVVAMSVPTPRRIPRRAKCGTVHGRCSFQESECCRRIVSRSAEPLPAFAASYSSRTFFGTPTKTSPPVGGTSRRIPLPVVVLPHPLSPTRQKISPLPTSRSTPSTARTYSGVVFRNAARKPRRFSNHTRKSRRTRYGSRAIHVASFGGGVVVFKWHAAKWPSPTGSRPGSWSTHSGQAYLHRGWKRQPTGGVVKEGRRAGMFARTGFGPPMFGEAAVTAFVYGR